MKKLLILAAMLAALAAGQAAAKKAPEAKARDAEAAQKASEKPAEKAPAGTDAATPVEPASSIAVVTVHDEVDFGLEKSLVRRVQQAIDAGAQVIVFEMDTYGGRVDSAHAIGDFINGIKARTGGKVRTVAYIDQKAISAGAMISLACQQIVMRSGTTIGDCQAIMINPETKSMEAAPEKAQTMVRAIMRTYAQSNGYPVILAEAMVDPTRDIVKVTFPGDRVEYMTEKQYEELKTDQKKGAEKKLILEKGKLLTMSDTEAKEYGFSRASVSGFADVAKLYGAPTASITRYETNWSEEMVRFLNSTAVSSILMIVGMIALYMAFKTPGFGLPEGVAIACFTILFLSKYLVGLATVIDIVLFVAGVILLAVEIFLIPGFGLIGLAGVVCILTALVLSFQRFTIPQYDFEVSILVHNLLAILGSVVTATVLFLLIARFLPKTPMLRRLVLTSAQTPEAGYVAPGAELPTLVGQTGTVLTALRPAGRVEIDGRPLDVVAEGDFIAPGARVIVSEVHGNRIVVRKA